MSQPQRIAPALAEAGLDDWLFFDLRGSDPIAYRILGLRCDELGIQRFISSRIAAHGLVAEEPPIVAVNAHSAVPHFSRTRENSRAIGYDDFVLLDLWAKEPGPNSFYGDLTGTAFVGDSPLRAPL
jgi:Xaa-Pro aminopeptidase